MGSPRVAAREYFSASEHGNFFFLQRSIQALGERESERCFVKKGKRHLLRGFISEGTGEGAEITDHT